MKQIHLPRDRTRREHGGTGASPAGPSLCPGRLQRHFYFLHELAGPVRWELLLFKPLLSPGSSEGPWPHAEAIPAMKLGCGLDNNRWSEVVIAASNNSPLSKWLLMELPMEKGVRGRLPPRPCPPLPWEGGRWGITPCPGTSIPPGAGPGCGRCRYPANIVCMRYPDSLILALSLF